MLKTDALQSVESGFYSAINEDGVKIYVARQKGCGWTVYTPTHHGWYEAVDYDESGLAECVRYKKLDF